MARPHHTIPALSDKDIRRFWSKIEIKGENDCWLWLENKSHNGYGMLSVGPKAIRIYIRSNRMAYFLHYHKDPAELLVLHTCDNPPCCNPKHLWLGTTADNSADMVAKGRQVKGDKNCFRKYPELVLRGEKNKAAKLKEKQVIEIRTRYALGGVFQKDLAIEFGVNLGTIQRILARQTWTHI